MTSGFIKGLRFFALFSLGVGYLSYVISDHSLYWTRAAAFLDLGCAITAAALATTAFAVPMIAGLDEMRQAIVIAATWSALFLFARELLAQVFLPGASMGLLTNPPMFLVGWIPLTTVGALWSFLSMLLCRSSPRRLAGAPSHHHG